jgi:molecular chaperone DnaK (HSP70)
MDPDHMGYAAKLRDVRASTLMENLQAMDPDVATTAFLHELWAYTEKHMTRVVGARWRETYSPRVVLTVPATWTDQAKDRTRAAAKRAGLPDDIKTVSEPEAAALAIFHDLKKIRDEAHLPKIGEAFVVCDAGGGTVDLISYKVKGEDPLALEEFATGDGDLCGSVFIDIGFENSVRAKIGETKYQAISKYHRQKMLLDFDTKVKRWFTGPDQKTTSVELRGAGTDKEQNITHDNILITG